MRTTASKVGLLTHCQYFARDEVEWSGAKGADAEFGTRFHTAIARYVIDGKWVPAEDGSDEDLVPLFLSARAWVDHFGREALKAETAFAWDPVADTAEVIGEDIHREYGPWQAKGLLCMSADVVAVSKATKSGYVGDWSTGDGSNKGPQLRCLALALARTFGLDSVTVEALEVDANGVRHVCTETLDAFALAAVAGELAESLAAVLTATPQPGEHCASMNCPAVVSCPVAQTLVAELVPVEALTRYRWSTSIESPDHAAWLHERRALLGKAVEAVNEALKAACPDDGWVLSDGRVLREGERTMTRFDAQKFRALAIAAGVTEEQIMSCERPVKESAGLRISGGAAKPRKKRAA